MMWSRWGHKSAYTSSSSCQSRGGGGCEANYTLAWRSRLRRTSFRLHQPVECQADNSSYLLDLVANKDHFRILAPIRVWEGGGRERRMRSKNPFLPLLRLFMSPVRHLLADTLIEGGGEAGRDLDRKSQADRRHAILQYIEGRWRKKGGRGGYLGNLSLSVLPLHYATRFLFNDGWPQKR